jgi:DNA-3-methyladenine glycosylase I
MVRGRVHAQHAVRVALGVHHSASITRRPSLGVHHRQGRAKVAITAGSYAAAASGYRPRMATDERSRCAWGDQPDLEYRAYHDLEWGVPVRDERHLFELLVLEGAQAGLSWSTILHKREGYRRAFAGFDIATVAAFGEADVERLLADPGIVRNRLKVTSAIDSARGVLALQTAGSSLVSHLWSFTGGAQIVNRFGALGEIPAETDLSRAISRDLRARGFRFVGPTIVYALMQSAGLVNDHETGCYRWAEVQTADRGPTA